MRLRGLSVMTRTNVPGDWNLIGWHSPHSLTWSWFLGFTRFRSDEARVRPLWWSYRVNGLTCADQVLQWGVRIPWLGMVSWHRQRPMWYRDLMNDERERLSEEKHDVFESGRRQGRRDVFQGVGRSAPLQ